MRTAIFVNASTTVTISTQETNLSLEPWGGQSKPLPASSVLPPGVYKIVSSGALAISPSTETISIQATDDEKKSFPDPPPPAFATAMNGASQQQVVAFFATGKGWGSH